MKIFKYVLYTIGVLVIIFALFVFIFNYNKKSLIKLDESISLGRDKAKDSKSIASIKFISTSIMLFEDEKNRAPLNMEELNSYSPIPGFAISTVQYTASTTKSFDYKVCAPYTSNSITEKNTETMQWYLSSGKICLHSK